MSDAPRRRRDLLLGLALLALGVGVGAAVWARGAPSLDRPGPGPTSLEGTVDLRAAKAGSLRVKVDGPATLEVTVDGPAGLRLAFGPPGPVEADAGGSIDPAAATTWTHEGGVRARTLRVATAAVHVLRVETEATPGPTVAVRVRETPFR